MTYKFDVILYKQVGGQMASSRVVLQLSIKSQDREHFIAKIEKLRTALRELDNDVKVEATITETIEFSGD